MPVTRSGYPRCLVPDLIPYLKVNQLRGAEGTWILLQGNLRQEDNQTRRETLAFLQGLHCQV